MKAISCVALCVIAVVASAALPILTHADTQKATVAAPARLINLLSTDDIVSLRSSDGAYDISILDDRTVRSFGDQVERLKEKIESAATEIIESDEDAASRRNRIEKIESGWYNLSSPWKVVLIGEDFVRLEPIAQLPRHEKLSWIAIAQTSIRQIKSKK